jgi:prepilin signal peptidase PulO-like enzyme (type II secretory pathway)
MNSYKLLIQSMQDFDEKIIEAEKNNAKELQKLLENEANVKKLQVRERFPFSPFITLSLLLS